ncbi:MAG: TGS domain-containing protein, partial [Candidatus Heimdallarchaeaceae archaeon]
GESTYKFGIIATKGDLPNTKERYQELAEITDLPICPISIKEEGSLEKLKKTLFEQLEIIRIYSKKPGTKPNLDDPLVLPEGAAVFDIARKIHTSFVDRFRYARVTGASAEFESQQVGIDHVLADEDIVELIVTRR